MKRDDAQLRRELGMPDNASLVHIGPISIYEWQRLGGERAGGRVKKGEWADYTAELFGEWVPLDEVPRPCPWPLFIPKEAPTADAIRAWLQVIRHVPTGGYMEGRWRPDTGLRLVGSSLLAGSSWDCVRFIRGNPLRRGRGRRWGTKRKRDCGSLLADMENAAAELYRDFGLAPAFPDDVMVYTEYKDVPSFLEALRRCGETWEDWLAAHTR